jgi:hypothetical protein
LLDTLEFEPNSKLRQIESRPFGYTASIKAIRLPASWQVNENCFGSLASHRDHFFLLISEHSLKQIRTFPEDDEIRVDDEEW